MHSTGGARVQTRSSLPERPIGPIDAMSFERVEVRMRIDFVVVGMAGAWCLIPCAKQPQEGSVRSADADGPHAQHVTLAFSIHGKAAGSCSGVLAAPTAVL